MARRRASIEGQSEEPGNSRQYGVLPAISHLQFLALDVLRATPAGQSASSLRAGIAAVTPEYEGPKFYQLMNRLAEAGLVVAETRTLPLAGEQLDRTHYMLTPAGEAAHRVTAEFYATRRKLAESLARTERRRG